MTRKHFWLYVLLLEKDKYYVGITTKTPEIRFHEHTHKIRAANWTLKYKPVKIIYTKDLGFTTEEKAKAYENKVVRKYMKLKGYNSTRGGDITDIDNYTKFGGYLYKEEAWYTLKVVVVLMVIILFLTVLNILK